MAASRRTTAPPIVADQAEAIDSDATGPRTVTFIASLGSLDSVVYVKGRSISSMSGEIT